MPTYKEALKLAKEYALSARLAFTKQGAAEAWGIAKKYQDEAAKLDFGRKPDIGPPPLLSSKETGAAPLMRQATVTLRSPSAKTKAPASFPLPGRG